MSQKSSLLQPANSVSQALIPDISLIPAHRLDAVLQRPQNAGQKPGGAGEQIRSSSGNRFGHANQNKLGQVLHDSFSGNP